MKLIILLFKLHRAWLSRCLSLFLLLGGLLMVGQVRAQTCPAGWTPVANDTIYPVSAMGTASSGTLNSILFGGADKNAVDAPLGIVMNFGQVLAAGGKVEIIITSSFPSLNYPQGFNISFSTDGTTFSTAQAINAPKNNNFVTYTVTAPQAFQYIKVISLANNYTGYDAIRYIGSFCQAPPVANYADCASGQGQVRATITPVATSYPWSISKGNNVLMGPDANLTPLANTAQNVIVKFAKVLSVGDSIQLTGYRTGTSGNFTVLTSVDGVNFTTLQNTSFTNTSPTLQTITIRSTQSFQYVKVLPSGTGQVSIDAISVFGKTCVTASGTCPLAYTTVAPASILSTPWTGTANSILTQDGTVANFNQELIVDYGQSVMAGADIDVVAAAYGGTYTGSFDIHVSSDNVIFSAVGITTGIAAGNTTLNLYKFNSPFAFRYVRLTPKPAGTSVIKVDYLGVTGISCPPCDVTGAATVAQASCIATGGVNADAKLILSSYGGGATKAGYSVGSSYTGPAFSAATAVTAAPMTLTNTLANPISDQPYTIRVFKNATCYKDIAVILKPQVCLTSDISVSVSPLSQSAASGEMQTYVVTVTNAGPDPSDVQIEVPIPVNRTFLSASPQQGTYTESTHIWNVGNLAVGSKTLTLTIKVN